MSDIASNIKKIKMQIAEAAQGAGRNPDEVTLVAVSKRHPVKSIREAYAAGQRDFGENYAQELRDKALELSDLPDIKWHFIGHLQRNKVKYVIPSGAMVETVDSTRLIDELSKQAERLGRSIECLVQVNVGLEAQKSGCKPSEVSEILSAINRADKVMLKGFMTIPPWDLNANETRPYFSALAKLLQEHGDTAGASHLSMGMSHDFKVAVEEGATLVRVGTAIFGARPAI